MTRAPGSEAPRSPGFKEAVAYAILTDEVKREVEFLSLPCLGRRERSVWTGGAGRARRGLISWSKRGRVQA